MLDNRKQEEYNCIQKYLNVRVVMFRNTDIRKGGQTNA